MIFLDKQSDRLRAGNADRFSDASKTMRSQLRRKEKIMEKMKDGWHTISGYEVYVEDGFIRRGIKYDQNGGVLPAFVYRWDRTLKCWNSEEKISPDAFRAGVRRESIRMF